MIAPTLVHYQTQFITSSRKFVLRGGDAIWPERRTILTARKENVQGNGSVEPGETPFCAAKVLTKKTNMHLCTQNTQQSQGLIICIIFMHFDAFLVERRGKRGEKGKNMTFFWFERGFLEAFHGGGRPRREKFFDLHPPRS